MKFDLQRTGDDAVIVAGGRLTSSGAGTLHKIFLEAFAGASRVDLFLHDVQEVDLAFLQLLCAAQRTAAAQGTVFTVGGLETAAPVLQLIRDAGAQQGVGFPAGCVWAGAFGATAAGESAAPGRRGEP